jgi:hypothetical protein
MNTRSMVRMLMSATLLSATLPALAAGPEQYGHHDATYASEDFRLQDENSRGATTTVRHERARSEEGISADAEILKPCDAAAGAGSASGEPSSMQAERSAARAEFLRNVWTTP